MKLTAEYPVPAPVQEFLDMTIEIRNVQIGDARGARKVAKIKSGPKNTELLADDGKRIDYLPNDTLVAIIRTRETNESSEARNRARRNQDLLERMNARTDILKKARARFDEELDQQDYVGHWRLDDLLGAQARLKIWHRFAGMVHYIETRVGEQWEGTDLLDARDQFVAELKSELLSKHNNRVMSRSTSQTSNYLEDLDREALVEFIHDAERGW